MPSPPPLECDALKHYASSTRIHPTLHVTVRAPACACRRTARPDRMPIFFWREDLDGVRRHLASRWGGPDECFDEAFANITRGGGGMG